MRIFCGKTSRFRRSSGAPFEARAVKVVLRDRTDYVISALNPDKSYILDGRIKFQGAFGVYSEKGGKPEYGYVHDGTLLAAGDQSLVKQAAGRITGKVDDFTKELAERNFITVSPVSGSSGLPDLAGKYIFIENGYPNKEKQAAHNAVYRIAAASAASGGQKAVLSIGDTTLIGKWRDASDFLKGYEYDIQAGNVFSIALTYTWKLGK